MNLEITLYINLRMGFASFSSNSANVRPELVFFDSAVYTFNASHINAGTITGDRLAAGAITARELEADAVTADKVASNAINAR